MFTTEVLDTISIVYTIYTYIVILAIAAFTTLALQNETRNTLLKDDRVAVGKNRTSHYGSLEGNHSETAPVQVAGE